MCVCVEGGKGVNVCVGSCLATKGFISKLLATGGGWVTM